MPEAPRNDINKLRRNRSRLKKVSKTLKEIELDNRPSSKDKKQGFWTVYDNGAFGNEGYFKEKRHDSFQSLISFNALKTKISEKKEHGKKTIVLDVMGQGRIGYDLGADTSIGWTLKSHGEEILPGREIDTGDVMKADELNALFSKLDARLADPKYELEEIFYRAVGGFGIYADNDYALAYLYDRVLKPLFDRVAIGGHIFLAIELGPITDQPKKVMDALKSEGFDVRGPEGACFVITKNAEDGLLPSLRTLAAVHGLFATVQRP